MGNYAIQKITVMHNIPSGWTLPVKGAAAAILPDLPTFTIHTAVVMEYA